MRRFLLLAATALSTLAPSFAQTPQTGLYQFGPYDSPGADTINRGNLNVHLSIPVFSKAGRAGTNFSFTLNYDSTVWTPSSTSGSGSWQPAANWGWTTVSNAEFGYISYNLMSSYCTLPPSGVKGTLFNYSNFVFHDQYGRTHPFSYSYQSACLSGFTPTGTGSYAAGDNSFYTIYRSGGSFVVFTKTGEQYSVPAIAKFNGHPSTIQPGAGVYTDTNGNQITASYNSSTGTTSYVDTTGATVLTATGTGTAASPNVYTYTDTTGTPRTVTVNYTNYNVTTKFGVSGVTEYSATSIPLVSSIVYADGSQYSFTYEYTPGSTTTYTGRLGSVTLPSGGKISYAYTGGSNGIESDGSASGLTRTTSDGTVSYARSGVSSTASTTTFTDAYNPANTTVATYLEDANGYIYETSRSVYAGAASGTPLQQVTTCYSQSAGCPSNSVAAPIGYVTTTLAQNGIAVGSDTKQYSGGFLISDNNGYITETTGYQSFTGVDDIGFARVSSVTDVMGSTQIAKTTYTYDETTGAGHAALATPPGTPPQHGGAVPALRGNLTTVSRWLNTSSSVSAEAAYDTTGQMVSSMDPRGSTTTYGYDSGTDAFLTNVTYPTPSSGVGIGTSATYDYANTGLPATSTDANGVKTTYTYNKMLQLTNVAVATSGGTAVANTAYSYSGSALPETITTTVTATPSPNQVSTTTLDGLGRISTAVGPNGATSKVTYDAMGRIHYAYNPYFTASDPTYGYAIFGYDALGRATLKTQPDKTTQSWSYNGNAVTFTNETDSQWQQTFDGMGRLIKVLEPSPTVKTPIIETDYAYNGLITKITQNGVSGETPRVRTFTSDLLGRPITAVTPEAGTVCYGTWSGGSVGSGTCQNGYDANGNLLAKTDARNVTLSWIYDSLNRPLTEGSSDSSVGNNYSYDYSGDGSYGVGRLFGAFGAKASTGFYYDPMGRVSGKSYYTPSTDTWLPAFSAAYDMAGDLTSLTYPDGRIVTQAWNSAGQLNSETYASLNGHAVNYNYLSSAAYFASGAPQTMNFGNGTTQTVSGNSRLQTAEIALQMDAAGLNRQIMNKWFCYGPATPNCANYGIADNGNIQGINDTLNTGRLQGFAYDNLNRMTGFGTGNQSISQGYAYDSFGNMNQNSGTFQTNYSFNASNQISDTGFSYDAGGNLTQANLGGGTVQQMAYAADGKLLNVNGGATASYIYDAEGNRARKNVGSGWTEYVYFNGQPYAQKNADGSWYDYIYANGQRIARAEGDDIYVQTSGTTPGNAPTAWTVSGPSYVIQPNDQLLWRQLQFGGYGGLDLIFTDGSQTLAGLYDNRGVLADDWQTENQWQGRSANLNAYAGKTIASYVLYTNASTPAGAYTIRYADMAILSADGTVTPIYYRRLGDAIPNVYNPSGQTNLSAAEQELTPAESSPQNNVTYYHSDHLGSGADLDRRRRLAGLGLHLLPLWRRAGRAGRRQQLQIRQPRPRL